MVALLSEVVPGLNTQPHVSSFEVADNYRLGVWKP